MLLGWIVRVVLLAVIVLIVRLLIAWLGGMLAGTSGRRDTGVGRRPAERSVALVKDPVCGVYIEPGRAVSSRIGSTVHYFCSETCERTFRQKA